MTMVDRRSITSKLNAQRSTGPRTPEGKAAARLNAMRHGIYSEVCLIDGETEGELIAFGKRLRAEFAPVGEFELMLADKIVATAWRLRRLVQVEAALFDNEKSLRDAFGGYSGNRMLQLGRQEAGLERALYRALHELQRLQAARHGADVPVPEVVDVTVSGTRTDAHDDGEAVASFRQNDAKGSDIIKQHARHAERP